MQCLPLDEIPTVKTAAATGSEDNLRNLNTDWALEMVVLLLIFLGEKMVWSLNNCINVLI